MEPKERRAKRRGAGDGDDIVKAVRGRFVRCANASLGAHYSTFCECDLGWVKASCMFKFNNERHAT